MKIVELAEQTIKKFKMLKVNDRVIVAVSGGADSVALVYLLHKLKKHWQLYLHLAHLNHMLRKEEADADQTFVEQLGRKLKLPVTSQRLKVEDFAQANKLSFEEAARQLRYNFLLKVAKDNFASKIASGHNRDDQAETVLMRLLRGTGISGLRGIPVMRQWGHCLIIRPLIELTRRQILHFLQEETISYRTDSSNQENLYFRNRVRNKLLPLLEQEFNSNIKEILVNLAENMSCDFDFLEKTAQTEFKAARISSTEHDSIMLKSERFFGLPKALQKMVARWSIKELKGDTRQIDFRHWQQLEDLIRNRPPNSIVDFPAGISVVKKRSSIAFYKR